MKTQERFITMKLELYQIDAFSDKTFSGNPACVVPLDHWLSDDLLLNIARENAVAETAFFIDKGDKIHLRWFTPEIEMDLCGHATLATAHCLKSILNYPDDQIVFETLSGDLRVTTKDDFYFLDFPSRMPETATLPDIIKESLSLQPKAVYKSRDYLLVYETEEEGSRAFPFAIPLATSNKTTSFTNSFVPIKCAKVPPI